ncbi:MAG: tetratricopeptide repeat protein [Rhabdaerophilum calidifontis]
MGGMQAETGRRRTATLLVATLSTLALAGCSAGRLGQFTGSLRDAGREQTIPATSADLAELGRRYDRNPGEKRASLDFAQALRQAGQHGQAVAVLQRASISNVGDAEIAAAYGRALAEVGRFEEARSVLVNAHSADRPDWRVLSTQGSVADQLGDHVRARAFYAQALAIAPNQPGILNNLGLSHLLTRDLAKAEEYLRLAAAQPGADARVRANLALALRLQGRNAEADSLDGGAGRTADVAPPRPAAASRNPATPRRG